MNSIERFKKQKATLKKIEQRKGISLVADRDLVDNFLASEADSNAIQVYSDRMDEQYNFNPDTKVTDQEVNDLLLILRNDFDNQHFNELVSACKKDVISAIINPFGLGMLVAKLDKNGGNVTTVNNAKQNVYAKEEDKYNRKEYTHSKNNKGQAFAGQSKNSIGSEFTKSQLSDNGTLIDAYTGKVEFAKNTSPDHIVSTSEFHKNGGFMLSSERKADFATDTNNLASTNRSINQSMSDADKQEWAIQKQNNRETTNSEYFDIDNDRLTKNHKRGKETSKIHEPDISDKTKYYGKAIAYTGATEATKMGAQQALGLVLYEFFDAAFDEIEEIYQNGFSTSCTDDHFLHVVKERFSRIATRIASRWKDVGTAFAGGFISGLLSNLVTVVINMFVRTGKRMVRMIREGFYSLLRAIKMLYFPPQGMTHTQAAHEASKLIATGLVVIGGIVVEQHIDAMIKAAPMLEPFADVLTSILVGSLTGLATTLVVYTIDKIDFFNVNEHEKHTFIMNKLETNLSTMFAETDLLIADIKL